MSGEDDATVALARWVAESVCTPRELGLELLEALEELRRLRTENERLRGGADQLRKRLDEALQSVYPLQEELARARELLARELSYAESQGWGDTPTVREIRAYLAGVAP